MQRSDASTIRFSALLARTRIRTSDFTSQDDVSHPDSERELVFRGGFGVEAEDLGDESVRSDDRHLRISPPWLLAR